MLYVLFKPFLLILLTSLDIWSNQTLTNKSNLASLSAPIGYSSISGVCGPSKYSVVEFIGFNVRIYVIVLTITNK
jgi:hypothetical protein